MGILPCKVRFMITRSRSKMPRDDIKGIIEQALEPVKAELQSLPSKEYFDEVINRLEGRLRDQDDTIKMLTGRVKDLEVEITKMQTLEQLIDDIKQYDRRLCVRIDNMPVGEKETSDDCLNKVVQLMNNMDIDVYRGMTDRAHRIRKKFIRDEDGESEDEGDESVVGEVQPDQSQMPSSKGQLSQQVIVKFTSWRARTLLYRKRKNSKQGVKIKLDLTKERLDLLKFARRECKGNEKVDFVFADVNCNLVVRSKRGEFIIFHSKDELKAILQTL